MTIKGLNLFISRNSIYSGEKLFAGSLSLDFGIASEITRHVLQHFHLQNIEEYSSISEYHRGMIRCQLMAGFSHLA